MTQSRSELAQHWPIVLGAAIGLGCGINQMSYIGSLFIKAMQADFGWSRGQIAASQASLLLGMVAAPVVGWMVDRFGTRRVAIASAAFLGLGFLAMSAQTGSIYLYYAISTAIVVLGSGTGPISYTRSVVTWFEKSRGLALALALIGTSVIALGLAPLLSWLVTEHGWRAGYLALAGLAFVAVPVVFALVRDKDRPGATSAQVPPAAGMSFMQTARDYRLYVLVAVLFLATMAIVAVVSQLAPLLTDRGVQPKMAGFMISVLALATIVGRVAVGFAFDRVWAPLPAMAALMAAVVGCLMLGLDVGLWASVTGVALIGFAQGAEVDIVGFFISRYFGVKAYAVIYSVVGVAFSLGIVAGAVLAGAAYDMFQNYDAVLIGAAASFGLSALLILLMGRYPPATGSDFRLPA